MLIEKDRVVSIDYTLKNANGEVIDSSEGTGPLEYIQGHSNIIPGLEKKLEGKKPGDKFDCVVPASEAYGERDVELVINVPRAEFGEGASIEPGMQFEARDESGAHLVTVVGVNGDEVSIDANHPLAGMELHFSVAVLDVRQASAEELARGSVHGGCGCGCGGDDCGCDCEGDDCDCGGDDCDCGSGGCGCH